MSMGSEGKRHHELQFQQLLYKVLGALIWTFESCTSLFVSCTSHCVSKYSFWNVDLYSKMSFSIGSVEFNSGSAGNKCP
ncbi:hypothetical protein glysoja_020652 [Glycine soja]|nr:hypothetical protein glysoja_020652 [Glycine soja]